VPTINPDRTPAAADRLKKALALLKRRNNGDAARHGATISELCRLAGVSRNAIYRYHPTILATLRRLQGRSADPAGQWSRSTHAVDYARLQDQLSKLAALVDHYYSAYRETRTLLDRRDRQLAELRRKLNSAPTAIFPPTDR
jgi:AcrR family transcriptional regulator